jgi:hypothetical protein
LTVDASWTKETLSRAFTAKGRAIFIYSAGATG